MNLYLRLIICSAFFCVSFNLFGQPEDCPSTIFEVGNEWIYTNGSFQGGTFPASFRIEDEVEWEGRQALVLRPGISQLPDYMVQEEGRVYFWDEGLGAYELNYDYNNDSLYYIRHFDGFADEMDSIAVFIDSIGIEQIDNRNIQVQYCRSDLGFGGPPQPFKVYRGIGASSQGVRFPIGIIDYFVGDLRCFDSPDCSIKFVDFPCDTTTTVSVHDLQNNLNLKIHPNPVNDRLYLETTDQNWSYQIINLQGQQIMQGQYQDHIDVDQLPAGIYFLQMEKEGELHQAIKFVKE